MTQSAIPLFSQYLRHLRTGHNDPSSDHELLQRFVTHREESAFTALVERHAAMVLGLCRSILRNHHDAEDIFQATFLVLARKAGSIRKGESVGSWLYAVAYRLAHKLRIRAEKRQRCEQRAVVHCEQTPMDAVARGELRDILHQEVSRLPEKYRAAVMLCYWQGRTHEQAGEQLGCARGTIKDRLEKARELLRKRLARRELALSASWFATSLSEGMSATVSAELMQSTVRSALLFSMGRLPAGTVSPNVLASAKDALQAILLNKLKYGGILVLILGLLSGSAGIAVLQKAAVPEAPKVERDDREEPKEPLPAGAVQRLGTLRFRHGDPIRCIALGADGDRVISVAGKCVYVWDLATGKERRRFVGHEDEVNAVACSRDGKRIASLSVDGKIILWDAATGKELRRILAHTPSKNQVLRSWQMPGFPALAFTPDGQQLISRGSDNSIRLWDTATGAKKREFFSFSVRELKPTSALGFVLSPDGKYLASLEGKIEPNRLKLWEFAAGRVLKEWTSNGGILGAFSPDGKIMALQLGRNPGSPSADFELWDIAGMKKIRAFPLKEAERILAFSPDGKTFITAVENTAHFRDVQTGKILARLYPQSRVRNGLFPLNQFLFCRDGKTLVSFSHFEHALRLWDLASGKELHTSGEAAEPIRCTFSPDGRFLAGGSHDGTIRLWDTTTQKEARRIHQPLFLSSMLWSGDGRLLATGNTGDPVVHIWEVAGGEEKRRITTPGRSISQMAWSGDGKLVATWSQSESLIQLWDAVTGKEVHRWNSGDLPINGLAFSPNGKSLAAACNYLDKGTMILWEVDRNQRRTFFEASLPAGLKCLAFSPDGRTVAAGALDGCIYLWELISGRRRATLKAGEIITTLSFSPDGKILAAAGNASYRHVSLTDDSVQPSNGKPLPPRVHLWDMDAEKELPSLEGHQGSVTSLSFSPDGKLLATGSNDTTVLLWDATRFRTHRPTEVQLRPEQFQSLWADLGGGDAVKAYRAISALAAAPKSSVEFLKQHLHPVAQADAKLVARLIADLDSDQFALHNKAMQELEQLGDRAATELRKALDRNPPLEVKRRIEQLLDIQNGAEHIRVVRALETLERIGTSEARELCARLAEGVPDAPMTREARATLKRMTR